MTKDQEEEVGRHPVSVDPVHPGYSQGALGSGELPQTSLHFWKLGAAYPIVNPAMSGLFPALRSSPVTQFNQKKDESCKTRPKTGIQTGAHMELPL